MLLRASFIETRDCGAENFIKHFLAADVDPSRSQFPGFFHGKSDEFSKNEAELLIG